MRLASIQTSHGPRAAIFAGDHYIDLHTTDPELPTRVRVLPDQVPAALRLAADVAHRPAAIRYPAADVRLLAPIPNPHKILCIGLNYRDHAAETGAAIPREPVVFSKFATALIGPD